MSVLTELWTNLTNNFKKSETEIKTYDMTRQPRRAPAVYDTTDSYPANITLTRGLYHNTYPGFKLAGGLAFPPIAVPVWFMGLPIPSPEDDKDEQTAEDLNGLVKEFQIEMQQNHIECHRDGTVWIWPHWSARANRLIWEFIPDDAITDIIRDIETGDIVQIITDEQLLITTGYQKAANVRRIREFTKEKITVNWIQGRSELPKDIKDVSMRNTSGVLPLPFANNGESGMVRGHSDYERILSDLKGYHDIDLARSTMLAKFQPKMIQQVSNVDQWLANNGWATIADIDIASTDLILNLTEQESTTFEYPDGAYDAYSAALKQKFQKIVEASGVPEITWGLKTEGNRASVEESMGTLIKYVHDKQDRKTRQYEKLFSASLRIKRMATIGDRPSEIKVEWNDLDAVSDEVRSIIFRNFASGVQAIMGVAGITKEQLYNLWMGMYPQSTDENFEDFNKGLSDMGAHKQWTETSYTEALDFQNGGNGGNGGEE